MSAFDFSTLQQAAHGGLDGTIRFAKFDRDVNLVVECDVIENISPPQRDAVTQFLDWDTELFNALEPPIFRYYRGFVEMTGLEEPRIVTANAVWPHVHPLGVIIPEYENGHNTYVQLELNCDWDIEHGMEWNIRNAKDVLYVGPFEGNCFERLDEDGPGGYVLKNW